MTTCPHQHTHTHRLWQWPHGLLGYICALTEVTLRRKQCIWKAVGGAASAVHMEHMGTNLEHRLSQAMAKERDDRKLSAHRSPWQIHNSLQSGPCWHLQHSVGDVKSVTFGYWENMRSFFKDNHRNCIASQKHLISSRLKAWHKQASFVPTMHTYW